jgi:hypothetical protein
MHLFLRLSELLNCPIQGGVGGEGFASSTTDHGMSASQDALKFVFKLTTAMKPTDTIQYDHNHNHSYIALHSYCGCITLAERFEKSFQKGGFVDRFSYVKKLPL